MQQRRRHRQQRRNWLEGESSASTSDTSEDAITTCNIPRLATRELQTFNILYTQRVEDGENLTSLVDGLLESNPKGERGNVYRGRVGF